MSDIFQEVEEEVRREQLRKLWDRYAPLVIAVAVAIVLAVAGWRAWEWWQVRQAQAAGVRFEAALRLLADGERAEADAAFAALEKDGPAGYAVLSRFARAGALASTDKTAAVTAFDALARDGKVAPLLRDLAQVRAGLLLVDTAPRAELEGRLVPLAAAQGAYRHTARELLALSAWRAGDRDTARKWVDEILGDPAATQNLRVRAEVMRDLLATPVAAPAAPAKTN